MENANQLNNYLALLVIREKAFHRNVFIAGGLFVIAILSTTGILLLMEWNSRSIWLMGLFDVLLTMNLVMTWARYQIIKGNIELLNNLQVHRQSKGLHSTNNIFKYRSIQMQGVKRTVSKPSSFLVSKETFTCQIIC